jgi:hypothetical protein
MSSHLDVVMNMRSPSTYSELIARLHTISSDRDLFATRKTSKTGNQLIRTQSRRPAVPIYDAEPMDWTPTSAVAINNTRPRKAKTSLGSAHDGLYNQNTKCVVTLDSAFAAHAKAAIQAAAH